jgi:ZIP family zinc transporter
MMSEAIFWALLAGMAIPAGALLASGRGVRWRWLDSEIRHTVMAFGGGALLSAVSFVLVPSSLPHLQIHEAAIAFFLGGVVFMIGDVLLHVLGGSFPQLLAMLADFIPESIALGALFATDAMEAKLLAIIIAAQNLPEGFNAYLEVTHRMSSRAAWALRIFVFLVPAGPIAAVIGMSSLTDSPALLSRIMLFAAGGILYLMFQDIAPQVPLRRHWLPPLGALGGFFVAIAGHYLLG